MTASAIAEIDVRTKICAAFCLVALLQPIQAHADRPANPVFSDYPATVYKGKLVPPHFLTKNRDVWRDDMGKMVSPPVVNTAGKFYMAVHSFGTACRYYTLNDLSTGEETRVLDQFSNDGATPKKSKDGRNLVIELVSKPDSYLILARYYIDRSDNSDPGCSARYFVLAKNGRSIKLVAESQMCRVDDR